ncbi:MAG: putative eukaryotic translation initiation factor 2 subunit 1 [Gaeavirus sp.]|uniref:Putative eukaryotic translation initiation factor 2 subunit 1 n=1 Tax=Gaeavirus sp. TaxID=2487767 RepID=A0A3G5A3D3_9VIRU|nr:MAG: putative eukaryotic translation initiation factor 2 subunit 1 [Gaeavirus sp.]
MPHLFKELIPKIGDIVFSHITEINTLNVVADLPDYNNMLAYISYAELSKKKRYKLNKIVNVNSTIVTQVTAISSDQSYVELSIRVLAGDDIEKFTKYHKKYTALYNLFRFIFMKLTYDELDLLAIDNNELYLFMNGTLWLILDSYEDTGTELFEKLYTDLLNPSSCTELINTITSYDKIRITKILNEYSTTKSSNDKTIIKCNFRLTSYEPYGCQNIKDVLNHKTFGLQDSFYDISIMYLTNGEYSTSITQKNKELGDINIFYDEFIEEIKQRSLANNIKFKMDLE